MVWDGVERRKDNHSGILPECKQIFIRLEEKIDVLIDRANKINGRYEEHLDSSQEYRNLVNLHEQDLSNIRSLRQWWLGALFTIIIALLSLAVIWGSTQTKINHIEKHLEKQGGDNEYNIGDSNKDT